MIPSSAELKQMREADRKVDQQFIDIRASRVQGDCMKKFRGTSVEGTITTTVETEANTFNKRVRTGEFKSLKACCQQRGEAYVPGEPEAWKDQLEQKFNVELIYDKKKDGRCQDRSPG